MCYKIVELNGGKAFVEKRVTITERCPGGKSYEKWEHVRTFGSYDEAMNWINVQKVLSVDPKGVKREEIIDV